MQQKYILRKDHVTPFLRKLVKGTRLIAPVRNRQGDLLYQELRSLDSATPDFSGQPQESAKAFLFPQAERLFSYCMDDSNGFTFEPTDPGLPTVLFGLRSCDISAILYMDVIFLRSPRDEYYMKRRSETIIIGISCNEPWDNCFCNATNTGPFLEFGFDLQLTDLGDRFFVESGRARGDAILAEWPQFFQSVTGEDEKLRYQLALEAKAGFTRQVHVETAFNRIREGSVSSAVWEHLAMRCNGCGGCAYICPTCTCFTIYDRPLAATRGERIRAWDACTHAGFTRMAGGYNPVDSSRDILKRRFMHKLYHDYIQFKRPGCVGCGRCLGICFGGVDIALFVDMVCSNHGAEIRKKAPAMLGELLVEAGLISRADMDEAVRKKAETGRPLGMVLMDMGLVSSEEITECLFKNMGRSDAER